MRVRDPRASLRAIPARSRGLSSRIGVILAGGQSSRMDNGDKADAIIGSKRLIDIVYDRIGVQCDDVLISAPHDYGLGIHCIEDDPSLPSGPAGGILSVAKVLIACPKSVDGFFTAPVDGPNLPTDLCDVMYNKDTSTIAMDTIRTHPSFAWWRLSDLNTVLQTVSASESLSLHYLARLCEARSILWSEPNLFFNINTANDLSNYLTDTISADND